MSAEHEHVQRRPGAYADSVTLMQLTARAQAVSGVRAAMVAMATELNLGLLADLGMTAPADAGQHDLLVAIRADDGAALAEALEVVDGALAARPAGSPDGAAAGQAVRPRTTSSAIARSGAGIALVSVPGRFVFAEAADALSRDCDVMIFSNNVPVEHEVALKDMAAERGLLVMGPDCGTAIVGGLGLGFANAVRSGAVGVVAASGTGAQQLTCLLDLAGVGCSAVLGLGGRDLSAAVGGRSARAALDAIDSDPATELIVVVSKPPAPEVAATLRDHAGRLSKPVHFALVGPGQPDLTAAAETVLRSIGAAVPDWPQWTPPADKSRRRVGGALRGLFSGGTLCDEATVIATERIGGRYAMIDFGADELTQGRPHPMIDQRLRLDHLAADAEDPATAVILLDCVLGYGAHPDPAADLAPAIAAARARSDVEVVVSLIGTHADPQGLAAQAVAFTAVGAHVFASNARAARFACDLLSGPADEGQPA